jgi:hypothetical protein
MLTTQVFDEGNGNVAYIVRCDEHGMAGSYNEIPFEDRYVHGPMVRISRDLHLLADQHPTPPEPWYVKHEQCRWFNDRPCWLNGGGHTGRPLSREYALMQAAGLLTCGCVLDQPIPTRRYHDSVLRHALSEIGQIAVSHGLTVAEVNDYLSKEDG